MTLLSISDDHSMASFGLTNNSVAPHRDDQGGRINCEDRHCGVGLSGNGARGKTLETETSQLEKLNGLCTEQPIISAEPAACLSGYLRFSKLSAEGVTAQPPFAVQRSSAGSALPTA